MLDLRPPTGWNPQVDVTVAFRAPLATQPHPAAPANGMSAPSNSAGTVSAALRGIGESINRSRGANRAELWARQFHHDGLSLLRPWENHSAFLSLGLNPHGKPGLWLVQKTR